MSRRTRLVLAPLAGAAAGVVAGAVVMGLVLVLVRVLPRDSDSWADLGLLVVGMFLAVAVGVLLWVGGLVWAARRLFDVGRRLGTVMLAVSAVFVMVLAVSALAGLLDDGAGLPRAASGALMWLGVVAVLATPSVVFVLRDRRRAVSP
jgi:hypothetical protein